MVSVLEDPADGPYHLAMLAAGVETITDLIELEKPDLQALTWTKNDSNDNDEGPQKLSIAHINRLLSLRTWFAAQATNNESVFLSLTREGLAAFRREQAITPATPVTNPIAPAVTTVTSALSPADEFKKGIKRDISAFKPFKDRRTWNVWYRNFCAIAHSQGVNNVLDPTFMPATAAEQALFDVMQAHVFAVFTAHLHQPQASDLVRKYSGEQAGPLRGDAQKLHQELCTMMTSGVAADAQRRAIETKIASLRLDNTWNKGIQEFLTHFSHIIRDLKDLVPSKNSPYNDNWCISALNTSLSTHQAMNSHINTLRSSRASMERTFASMSLPKTLPSLTFADYVMDLTNHAITLDANARAKVQQQRSANSVNQKSNQGNGKRRNNNQGHNNIGQSVASMPKNKGVPAPTGDVTDPNVFLTSEQYRLLNPEQRRQRYQRKQAKQASSSHQTNTIAAGAGVPPAVQVTTDARSDASAITSSAAPGSYLRNMMSKAAQRSSSTPSQSDDSITINGVTYHRSASATMVYRVHELSAAHSDSLIDGGANGGLLGDDARVIEYDSIATADVSGITDDTMTSLPIVQAQAKIDTIDHGPVIGIFSSYAKRNDGGRTIHSKGQLEAFGLYVDDKSRNAGGSQCIVTNEGYIVPLNIRDGLPYLSMSPPSDEDVASLPHVFFTADTTWDPTVLDNEFTEGGFEPPSIALNRSNSPAEPRTTITGKIHAYQTTLDSNPGTDVPIANYECKERSETSTHTLFDTSVLALSAFPTSVSHTLPDLDTLRPNFGWIPVDRIRATLNATTQYYRAAVHHPFRKHFRSRFPAANVTRLPEWFSTDTIFSDIPALDDGIAGHGGSTMLQVYRGVSSHFFAVYPMSTESQVASTLEDFIRDHGAMYGLISDNAKSETSNAIQNIFRLYAIKDRQSEPHYEHQNPVERGIQDLKRITNNIMDRVGCPAGYWLLCTLFVASLLNHLVNVNGVVPKSVITNQVTDVSAFLTFHFWQEVFYEDSNAPNKEKLGRWVGVATKQVDVLTYLVLTNDTKRIVVRSGVRPAKDPQFPNLRARPVPFPCDGDEVSKNPVIYSLNDDIGIDPSQLEIPKFSPNELLGLTFLRDTEDGERLRAKVTRKIMDRDAQNHQHIKFLVTIGDGSVEEIIAYNELSDIIDRQQQDQANGTLNTWTFQDITDHEGPLKPSGSNYKGSTYNVLVHWSDGSYTWEPLNMIAKDDPISLANYAKDNDLLNTPGWKFLRRISCKAKLIRSMLNQVHSRGRKKIPHLKFGAQVPTSVKDALSLD